MIYPCVGTDFALDWLVHERKSNLSLALSSMEGTDSDWEV